MVNAITRIMDAKPTALAILPMNLRRGSSFSVLCSNMSRLVGAMRCPVDHPVTLTADKINSAPDGVADNLSLVLPADEILIDFLRYAKGDLAVFDFAFFDFDLVAEEGNCSGQLIGLLNEG